MARVEDLLRHIRQNPKDVRFSDVCKVCEFYFGKPRQEGTSHCVYRTPWQGDPRINIQNKRGKARAYQVKQVLRAIERLESEDDTEK